MNVNHLPVMIRTQVPTARLPVSYIEARKALAECVRLDEVKSWEDKTAAIATYARQLGDTKLLEDARRLHLRAKVRIGELLTEYRKGAKAGRKDQAESRRLLAKQHGIDPRRAGDYAAAARVPKEVREARIEDSPPITWHQLRNMGRVHNGRGGVGGKFKASAEYVELMQSSNLDRFFRWTMTKKAKVVGASLNKAEIENLKPKLRALADWIDELSITIGA